MLVDPFVAFSSATLSGCRIQHRKQSQKEMRWPALLSRGLNTIPGSCTYCDNAILQVSACQPMPDAHQALEGSQSAVKPAVNSSTKTSADPLELADALAQDLPQVGSGADAVAVTAAEVSLLQQLRQDVCTGQHALILDNPPISIAHGYLHGWPVHSIGCRQM